MPGKLGSDFDIAKPADSDLTKDGAFWIRDIKSRLKSWAGALFDLDTGLFLPNIIPSSALKPLVPDPTGVYNQVTVNSKGQVTSGSADAATQQVSLKRWTFKQSGGLDPNGSTLASVSGLDSGGRTVATYSFSVPTNVKTLSITVVGAGGGGSASATGGSGGAVTGLIQATPGQAYTVWIGSGGTSGGTAAGDTKFFLDGSNFMQAVNAGSASGGTPGSAGVAAQTYNEGLSLTGIAGSAANPGPRSALGMSEYGKGGNLSTQGAHGLVIVEYYLGDNA